MRLRPFAAAALAAAVFLLAGCATQPAAPIARAEPPACPPAPACPACAPCAACPVCPAPELPAPPPPPAKPLQPARWEDLPGWAEDDPRPALAAFLVSCTAIDRQPDWRDVCAAARTLEAADAAAVRAYFQARFQPWRVVNPDGSTQGLVTGYYEPLLKGSRKPGGAYRHALYGVPDDLLVVDLTELHPDLKNLRLRGRLEGRRVVPYYSRAELERREAALADKVLAWVSDPIELFFLQVQGSGRVELPDGSRLRVGYADQNGHPYHSIGRWLVQQGELRLDQASMEGIKDWARSNPRRLSELLNVNPSYVFFRELPDAGGGPLGALGVALTEGRSLAVDPRTVPLGAPVFLATTQPRSEAPLRRLMVAQDTGGAIKGAVRADFFWGFGARAGAQAGAMRQQGSLWVLLPPELAPK